MDKKIIAILIILSLVSVNLVSGRGVYKNYEDLPQDSPPFLGFFKSVALSIKDFFRNIFQKDTTREVSLGEQEFELRVIDPLTWNGTVIEFNNKTMNILPGETLYDGGLAIRHRGNRKVNNTLESDIQVFYVGDLKGVCRIHYGCCSNTTLCWYYCDGTNYGVIQECDKCEGQYGEDYTCWPKGYFADVGEQDPQIVYENKIKEKIARGEEVDCHYDEIQQDWIGTECLN